MGAATVKCLASEATINTTDEVFNELDHLRGIFRTLTERLTDEAYLEQVGAGEATGTIMDQGMLLALANDRLERVIHAGQALRHNERAAKRLHDLAAGQEG
ncbi:MAG: hypothetical protein OEV17_05220 [Nitrospira sp.]|nr:hypothetical protein [Nitrospira sp.]